MTTLPTRWRTAIEDQLNNAEQRVARAERYLTDGDGGRAMQEVYPAVVAAATVRVWQADPPWERPMTPDEMQRRVRDAFPNLFAALAELDVQQVLTSPWRARDAAQYVQETRDFLQETQTRATAWLAQD